MMRTLLALIGNLGEDDLQSVAGRRLLQVMVGADGEAAAAGAVHPPQMLFVLTREQAAGGGEVRALDVLQDIVERRVFVAEQRLDRPAQLDQIVRRDVARHGHGDPGRAVQ